MSEVRTHPADSQNSGAMVSLAREARGYTQKRLAEESGVSQSQLSAVERMHSIPSADFLSKVAETLDYPQSFFYQAYDYRYLPVTFFRKRVSAPKRKVNEIQARLNILRNRISTLLSDVDLPSVRLPSAAVSGSTSPADVAQELRIAWHVRPGPLQNLVELIESAGIFVIPIDFRSPAVDGISIYEPSSEVPPMIFVSTAAPADRTRFSLAHELGHLVLHSHQPIPSESSESEADEFAAELLMPERDIRGHFSGGVDLRRLADLKPVWRVSMGALLVRAFTLSLISKRKHQYLWTQMAKYGYKKHEPIELEREKPSLLNELIQTHTNDLGRSVAQLMEQLHASPDDFREHFVTHSHLRAVR